SAQRDLSVSYNRLGDVHVQTGNPADALQSHKTDVEISEKLAQADPDSASAQRDLSVSYNRLGDVHVQTGNTADALQTYKNALEIREKLAQADPDSASAQRDLYISHIRTALIQQEFDKTETALQYFRQALTIARKLAKDRLNRQAQNDLEWVLDKLHPLAFSEKQYKKAAEYLKEQIDNTSQPHAQSWGTLSWYLIFAGQYKQAAKAAQKGLSIDPEQTWIATNLVHGHLLSGNMEAAKQVFKKYADKKIEQETFADVLLNDFKIFEEAGIKHPNIRKFKEFAGK
ncbi:MAG: tetratricopeptide repeat protein, partial [Desulfobacterales bacterium]|nr:tetratricopeptide repeat protein [Desulfobacterales bacterium]